MYWYEYRSDTAGKQVKMKATKNENTSTKTPSFNVETLNGENYGSPQTLNRITIWECGTRTQGHNIGLIFVS